MKALLTIALLSLSVVSLPVIAAAPAAAPVLAAERTWLDAYEQNDVAAMERIVADDFAITYPDGSSQSKADVLASVRKAAEVGHKSPEIRTEGTRAHFFGDRTVVLRGVVVTGMVVNGEMREMRALYTDTSVYLDGRWQVAASHLSMEPQPKKAG